MFKAIKMVLLYDTASVSTRKTVHEQIMEENRKFVLIWASVQMLYWGYCLIMSTKVPDFMLCRPCSAISGTSFRQIRTT